MLMIIEVREDEGSMADKMNVLRKKGQMTWRKEEMKRRMKTKPTRRQRKKENKRRTNNLKYQHYPQSFLHSYYQPAPHVLAFRR